MTSQNPHFLIIATGWNCADRVRACWDSIQAQTYENWWAVIISDGCWRTSMRLDRLPDHWQLSRRSYANNLGAAFRRHQAMDTYGDDFVVVLLGLDDELLPDALETIAEQYRNGKMMTYGNWIDQNGQGLPADFELHFDDATHDARDYRKVKYRSTAPNTFYAGLYKRIPQERFIYNGEWIKATTESPAMFACLEMCGKDRIGVIEKPIYKYFRGRPDNARKRYGDAYQDAVYKWVTEQPKMDLI